MSTWAYAGSGVGPSLTLLSSVGAVHIADLRELSCSYDWDAGAYEIYIRSKVDDDQKTRITERSFYYATIDSRDSDFRQLYEQLQSRKGRRSYVSLSDGYRPATRTTTTL